MKNLFATFFFVLAVAASQLAQAQTIRRVNNTGVAVSGVNVYSSLQAAHDAASSGDIIYLEPSGISYGALTCIRPLTIIGNGYYLTQNTGLQLDTRESIADAITFAAGSAGSRITGCTLNTSMNIAASNVTVERNRFASGYCYIGYNPSIGSVGVSGIIFRQNIVENGYSVSLYPGSTAGTAVSNVNITNNILTGGITSSGQYTRMSNILISNNVIGTLAGTSQYGIDVDNAVIKNNIMTYTGAGNNFTPRNNAYSYNIAGNAEFGTANGNQQNVTPGNLFVGGTASTDGAFQLRTTSPAIGTGESGVDVGAFGGALPYRLSGIPNVPTIYQYNQSVSGNSLNATISTRSNN
ncbi:hypothetical protein Q5H92_02085 [Hymenobacter sp. M29]|uniref:Right handed beta helix domain-containing protein n=1 Tax=Hymenobacter mellowenesis TaxID=3063995 RepID=A0ABT9A5L0_9BACT|nr:hypothetical protein [Hymenobacter sp. M29]MDO7845129.1 hypothetical protein [Hymenobacter sp. M29]